MIESVRTSTRSPTRTYTQNAAIEPTTQRIPVDEIASRPPPIATIALPDTANTSAATVRIRNCMTPNSTSATATTAG